MQGNGWAKGTGSRRRHLWGQLVRYSSEGGHQLLIIRCPVTEHRSLKVLIPA